MQGSSRVPNFPLQFSRPPDVSVESGGGGAADPRGLAPSTSSSLWSLRAWKDDVHFLKT